jgi:phospholipase/carboxylesterase
VSRTGFHDLEPVLTAGAALEVARGAGILLHGRGGTASGILTLAAAVDRPDVAWLAPQAAGNEWYPRSFLAPLEENEPWLGAALGRVAGLVDHLDARGVSAERVVVAGFSQGGCLAVEFAARNPRRYGGVAALAGGLIGPPGAVRDDPGYLAGTPVILGCSDRDPHIPLERVEETADVLTRMGAKVTKRIYPGLGHTVNDDEIGHLQRMLDVVRSVHAIEERRST